MVKLSSLDPLVLLFPPSPDEIVAKRSWVKLGRGPEDMSESTDVCRDRGLGEGGENTSPGKAFEMNK